MTTPESIRPIHKKVELTKTRLWFLYLFAGFIKAHIEDMTGWTRGEIDSGLDRWRLRSFTSASYWDTKDMIDEAIARRLGIPPTPALMDRRYSLQSALQEHLLTQFRVHGTLDWDAIDVLEPFVPGYHRGGSAAGRTPPLFNELT
ncbi:MAG: hypothetical protein IT379_14625 [Deltaproteobacteria bacterium]|nr:hypothetical protein [Deltaproteobacteria bacterium]